MPERMRYGTMIIAVFAGTRPEFIKLAPIIWKITEHKQELLFVHTGQHFDYNMSTQFIEDLGLPRPNRLLNVGSSSPGAQTARVLERAENVLRKERPEFVVVLGDTNSTVGVAIAAAKLKIPLGHVEAGCRSFDRSMPEELNRIIVADCAALHFAPTEKCIVNLTREGINSASVHLTGHPIVDLLNKSKRQMYSTEILKKLGLQNKTYVFLTVHREENSDNPRRLRSILQAVKRIGCCAVFPIHPRTMKNLKRFRLHLSQNVIATRPLPYFDTLALIRNAQMVITDSGGVQQEACILKTPCITLRQQTEWTETVEAGVNMLSGANEEQILSNYNKMLLEYGIIKEKLESTKGMFGDGHASDRIVSIVEKRARFLAETTRA